MFFRTARKSDGKRVEHRVPIGLLRDFPDEAAARAEEGKLHLPFNQVGPRGKVTFANMAHHYADHELVEHAESVYPYAHTTVKGYERILHNRLLPQWGHRIALGIQPLEVEEWLTAVKREEVLANPTLDKMRRVMSVVYRHGQRYGLIHRGQEANPMRFVRCKAMSEYEAMILTPGEAYSKLLHLRDPERTTAADCWREIPFSQGIISCLNSAV